MMFMELESLLSYFSAEGVWAILNVFLIFYIIKDQNNRDERQSKREENYQKVITDLTTSLKDVAEIKEMLKKHLNK